MLALICLVIGLMTGGTGWFIAAIALVGVEAVLILLSMLAR